MRVCSTTDNTYAGQNIAQAYGYDCAFVSMGVCGLLAVIVLCFVSDPKNSGIMDIVSLPPRKHSITETNDKLKAAPLTNAIDGMNEEDITVVELLNEHSATTKQHKSNLN